MSDLISREYMKSLGATCIASRSKDGTLFPIVAIDELPPADPTYEMPSNTLGALDCVDRQMAIDTVKFGITYAKAFNKSTGEVKELFREGNKALNEAVERLKDLPSVQSRKGKWILDNPHSEIYRYTCSECHAHHRARYDFCPSCGADMRGDRQ